MIDNFLEDNQLYLNFLEIKNEEVPFKNDKIDFQELYKIVERKFRAKARILHPDFGGNQKDFQFLLKCKQSILEHEEKEKLISLSFNEKIDGYDKDKISSQLGNQIFDLINLWSNDLNIKAIKKPTHQEDDNEWVFNILGTDKQLSLNIQLLSNELQELSNKTYDNESLNVLVCLFIPSKKLTTIKNSYDDSLVLKFNDLTLIETTNSKFLMQYFSNAEKLKEDLEKVRQNTFTSRENELKVKSITEAKTRDKEIFDRLSDLKLFNTTYNERAADFIDNL